MNYGSSYKNQKNYIIDSGFTARLSKFTEGCKWLFKSNCTHIKN